MRNNDRLAVSEVAHLNFMEGTLKCEISLIYA